MSTVVKIFCVITMFMAGVTARVTIGDTHQQMLSSLPAPYYFAYGVSSQPESVRYGHREESNGNTVKGAYSIALPDGRTQTVEYEADPINGYTAKVTYEATPGYTKPVTSTQDSVASGTTMYNQLPIVQMERSANTPQPKPRSTHQPKVQQQQQQEAQSSHQIAMHSVLHPNDMKRKVILKRKVPSTTTLQPRHVTTAHHKVSTQQLQTKQITRHQGIITQTPQRDQREVVYDMFTIPWQKLLRLPLLENQTNTAKHNSTNSTIVR